MFKSPIAWFEIVLQDFEGGCEFYSKAFNVEFQKQTMDQMQMAIFPYEPNQTGGALVSSPCYNDHIAGPGTSIIYLNCESVTAQLDKIVLLGGKVIFPVTQIGENGFIAGFEDSEGNHIGIWSEEE